MYCEWRRRAFAVLCILCASAVPFASGCARPSAALTTLDADGAGAAPPPLTTTVAAAPTASDAADDVDGGAPNDAQALRDAHAPGAGWVRWTSPTTSIVHVSGALADRVGAILCMGRAHCTVDSWVQLPDLPREGLSLARVVVVSEEWDPPGSWQLVTAELWRLARLDGGRVERRLLTRFDGWRTAAGKGYAASEPLAFKRDEDRVTVRLDGCMKPMGAWCGHTEANIQIDPPAVLNESNTYLHLIAKCQIEEGTWDWGTFSGSAKWQTECNGRCEHHAYDDLPRVALEGPFLSETWKTTPLGSCAVDVSGARPHGFTVFGETSGPADASFRAVLSGRTLFVEVTDDVFVGPTARWVDDDHVELWIAPQHDGAMSWCSPDSQPAPPKQWGIRIADARVFAGFGNPSERLAARVEHVDEHTARLRIELPPLEPLSWSDAAADAEWAEAITVAYSDSDDERGQKSIIATSEVAFGKTSSLGVAHTIGTGRATCSAVTGVLQPVRAVVPAMAPLW